MIKGLLLWINNIQFVKYQLNSILPASTLRYYEEVGILTDIPRNSSGKRIYLEKHINRLKTICCFKNTGMSIAQLQEFFQYEQQEPSHIDDILKLLTNQKNHILAQLAKNATRL